VLRTGPFMTNSSSIIDKQVIDAPLTDVVFQRLLQRIYSGDMPPGMVINEVALAREFGVSRGPIREAVRRLQGIQIVSREPYLKACLVEVSAETALELFQMRMGLEGMACVLAVECMSDEEIDQLLQDLEIDHEHRVHGREVEEGWHFDLHERVVRASRNKRII